MTSPIALVEMPTTTARLLVSVKNIRSVGKYEDKRICFIDGSAAAFELIGIGGIGMADGVLVFFDVETRERIPLHEAI